MKEIVNEVSRNISKENANLKVSDIDNVFPSHEKRFYNIFLIYNFESLEKFKHINEKFDFQGFFLVVMVKSYTSQYKDMKKILRSFWDDSIINVNVLAVAPDSSLKMFTFYPYSTFYCGQVFSVMVNKFVNSSFILSRKHYKDKLMNLFGCSLKVVTFNIPPLIFIQKKKGSYEVSGVEGELLKGKQDKENVKNFVNRLFHGF